MKRLINKKGFEMSFGWIFSVIVGATIIFLAIYGVSKMIGTERVIIDSKTALELKEIISPLSTSSESGAKPIPIKFPSETKIANTCDKIGNYGSQKIAVSTRSGIGKEWQEAGKPVSLQDNYLFSDKEIQGKEFFSMISPLNMPFKIGDLVVMWSDKYCFVNPSKEIEEDIKDLELEKSNILPVSSVSQCPSESKIVCFEQGLSNKKQCEISVDLATKRVFKKEKIIYYEKPFVYSAIFSDPELYECQISRITKKTSFFADVYSEKSSSISTRSNGCSSLVQPLLAAYASSLKGADSAEIGAIWKQAEEIEEINEKTICPIWKEKMQ